MSEDRVYVIKSKITCAGEKFQPVFNSTTGKMEDGRSLGFYILLEGSTESLRIDSDPLTLKAGDSVEIRISKRP